MPRKYNNEYFMFIFLIISLRIPNLMPCNKGAYRNKSGGGGQNMPEPKFFFAPPLRASRGAQFKP